MYKDYNYIYIDKNICSVVLTKMILKLSFPMTSKIEFNKDSMNNMHLTYTCKYLTISFLHFSNRIYEPQLPEGNIHGTNSKTTRNHSMLIYFFHKIS